MITPEKKNTQEIFEHAKLRLHAAQAMIPDHYWYLKPDPVPTTLVSDRKFMDMHVQSAIEKGVEPEGMPQVREQAFSQIATRFQTPESFILVKKIPEFLAKTVNASGMSTSDFYLSVLAHEEGHGLTPYIQNVSQEDVAKALTIGVADFRLSLSNLGFNPDEYSYDLYGRMIEIRRGNKFIETLGQTRDKRVEEILPDIYSNYLYYLDWCNTNGTNPFESEEPMKMLEVFRRSSEFARTINNNELVNLAIVNAAVSFGGFENLLRLFVSTQYLDNPIDTSDLDNALNDHRSPQRKALAAIAEADQVKAILVGFAKDPKVMPSLTYLFDNYTDFDELAKFLDVSMSHQKGKRQEALREAAAGAGDSKRHTKTKAERLGEPLVLRVVTEVYEEAELLTGKDLRKRAVNILKGIGQFRRKYA